MFNIFGTTTYFLDELLIMMLTSYDLYMTVVEYWRPIFDQTQMARNSIPAVPN